MVIGGIRSRFTRGALWAALAGFLLGALMMAGITDRYRHFNSSPGYFMLLDRFTGRLYWCFSNECKEVGFKEQSEVMRTKKLSSTASVEDREFRDRLDALDHIGLAGSEAEKSSSDSGFVASARNSWLTKPDK
ncbi:MAG: hypothetical protein WBX25_06085 [Rhodomicrobium sp.]